MKLTLDCDLFVELCASHQRSAQRGQLCGVCLGPWSGLGACLPAVGRSSWTDCVNRVRLCFHDWLPLLRGCREQDLGLVCLIF